MFNKTLSGTLMIAGITTGAGMLGIPLVTAQAGFFPAIAITVAVWFFMVATGLLFLEATLWMDDGANVLSMSERFLGKGGKWVAGAVYLFLYYCLMVAYFSVGAPIFAAYMGLDAGHFEYLSFGILFGAIVVFGIRAVDRLNYILMIAMLLSYFALIGVGAPQVFKENLVSKNWGQVIFAAPILFSAFGFHNIIPSLTTYFERDVKILRRSIIFGTLIPLTIYLVWQWLLIGVVPISSIDLALSQGKPATAALQSLVGSPWIQRFGQFFAFFAVITSMLGVAFSLLDFLADGFKVKPVKYGVRFLLSLLVFLPPCILSIVDPSIFVKAIGFAGGFGEAFLNGLLPVALVWIGRYKLKLTLQCQLLGNRWILGTLFALGTLVMLLEGRFLWQH